MKVELPQIWHHVHIVGDEFVSLPLSFLLKSLSSNLQSLEQSINLL